MSEQAFEIRTATREEVDFAIDLAAREGWNPGKHDGECYYTADPNGFFIGSVNHEPVATMSAVRYGADFGFVGLLIVAPPYRNHGYGIRLIRAAGEYLGGRNIGIDGVVEQQEHYRTLFGFRWAYRNVRYEGVAGRIGASPDKDIVPLSELPFGAVDAYDRPFLPGPRPAFTEAWIRQPDSHALGIVRDGELTGYGVIRACRVGHKVGPLYADRPDLAESLFGALTASVPAAAPVYLDVPEVNTEAVSLARRHGMTVVFETARMYSREIPDLPLKRVFGITSFEVG
jgi:GNAT superfamily N-acetyltransferase